MTDREKYINLLKPKVTKYPTMEEIQKIKTPEQIDCNMTHENRKKRKKITEQEVLKVFEEWGYHITTNEKYLVIFDSEKQFIIDKEQKQYFVSNWNNEHDRYKITFKEHYWLNKLFEIWGWFDE